MLILVAEASLKHITCFKNSTDIRQQKNVLKIQFQQPTLPRFFLGRPFREPVWPGVALEKLAIRPVKQKPEKQW